MAICLLQTVLKEEKYKMKLYITGVVLLCLIGAVNAKAAEEKNCGELLLSRCQSCHYLDRVCSQVGVKSERRWKATLKRMVKRRGAQLDDKEQKFLLKCLVTPASEIIKECKK